MGFGQCGLWRREGGDALTHSSRHSTFTSTCAEQAAWGSADHSIVCMRRVSPAATGCGTLSTAPFRPQMGRNVFAASGFESGCLAVALSVGYSAVLMHTPFSFPDPV